MYFDQKKEEFTYTQLLTNYRFVFFRGINFHTLFDKKQLFFNYFTWKIYNLVTLSVIVTQPQLNIVALKIAPNKCHLKGQLGFWNSEK